MIKKFIWGALVGGLILPLFGFSVLNWQWWIYVLIIIIGAFWAKEGFFED